MKVALIDGDIVAYRCGFAAEHKEYYATIDGQDLLFTSKTELNNYLKDNEWEEYEYESKLEVEPVNYVLNTVKRMIRNIAYEVGADETEIYLSDRANWRDKIATIQKYKGNRDDKRRPLHHDKVVEYMKEKLGAIVVEGLEADDMLAHRQLELQKEGHDPVICSVDKDLLQIPGKHYNFQSMKKLLVSEDTALKNKWMQVLTGDRTDNIPGLRKVGPVTAEKILADVPPQAYSNHVYIAWREAMDTERQPDWIISFDEKTGTTEYIDKDGDECTATLLDVVEEIEQLITIGVPEDGGRFET